MAQYSRTDFLQLFIGNGKNNQELKSLLIDNPARQQVRTSQLGLAKYSGVWDKPQILHLLRRSLFGVSHADYGAFSGKSLDECLSVLLLSLGPVPPPVNNYNCVGHIDADVPFGETWIDKPIGIMDINGRRIYSLKAWWTGLMLNQDHSLTEKMTLFWHNHFATQMLMVIDARYSYRHVVLLRTHALGNFKELTKAITLDPAMLVFLNGNTNTASAPNENYARELQELFTVGKGPDSKYTEADVKTMARVLTGWRDDKESITTVFDPSEHDQSDKKFSPFYGEKVIKGRKGDKAVEELDEMIHMIFHQRETAKFFCRKLYRWFVYYTIDSTIETNVISPMADILIANKYEVAPVLKALLGSEHFFDSMNIGNHIKNPVEALIGRCRQFEIAMPANSNIRKKYLAWIVLFNRMKEMAMEIGDPPSVSGWPAYYLVPQFYELWINSSTLPKRKTISDQLNSDIGLVSDGNTEEFGNTGETLKLQADLLAFCAKFRNVADPDKFITDSVSMLCPNPISEEAMSILKGILLSGKTSEHYWTDAWHSYASDPSVSIDRSVVVNRLIPYYSYLMDQAAYQLI